MSTIMLAACWPLQMPPTAKAVLISLADNANDQGVTWPAVATMSTRTCLSERAVRSALRWLEDNGVLETQEQRGTSSVYTITPQHFGGPRQEILPGFDPTPARRAPRQEVPPGTTRPPPRNVAPQPRHDVHAPPARGAPKPSINHQEPSGNQKKTREAPAMSAEILINQHGVDAQVAADFMKTRKAKRLAPTQTSLDGLLREFGKAGISVADGIRLCTEKGWGGFSADWLKDKNNTNGGTIHDQRAATVAALTGRNRQQGGVIDATADHVD